MGRIKHIDRSWVENLCPEAFKPFEIETRLNNIQESRLYLKENTTLHG
jgi:hypothetical protein